MSFNEKLHVFFLPLAIGQFAKIEILVKLTIGQFALNTEHPFNLCKCINEDFWNYKCINLCTNFYVKLVYLKGKYHENLLSFQNPKN